MLGADSATVNGPIVYELAAGGVAVSYGDDLLARLEWLRRGVADRTRAAWIVRSHDEVARAGNIFLANYERYGLPGFVIHPFANEEVEADADAAFRRVAADMQVFVGNRRFWFGGHTLKVAGQ
jgi:hypothetical protein